MLHTLMKYESHHLMSRVDGQQQPTAEIDLNTCYLIALLSMLSIMIRLVGVARCHRGTFESGNLAFGGCLGASQRWLFSPSCE